MAAGETFALLPTAMSAVLLNKGKLIRKSAQVESFYLSDALNERGEP
jgi:hypothetical protein